MAEGGNGSQSDSLSSSENIAEILGEKSSSSSDTESPNAGGVCPQPPPPLPLAAAAAACAAIAGEMQGIDRLLQKQRNDRMFELRKIQHGERPVSNTDSKERLEKFFAQSSEPTTENTERPARPDSVRVEVSGLLERRPVSSVIQSNTFRRNLESVIRGSLIRQERELQTALRLQSAGLPVQQNNPIVGADGGGDSSHHSDTMSQISHVSSVQGSNQSGEQQWNGGPPPPPPPGPPQMSPGMPQSPWQQSAPWQQQQQAWSQWQNMQSPPWQQPPWQQAPWQQPPWQQAPWQQAPWQQPPWQQQQAWQRPPWQQMQQQQQQHQASAPAVLPQQPWLTQRSQPQPIPGQEAPHSILADIQQQQRENVVSEISSLVQRQLVSNTLESNFRSRLEVTLQDRLSQQDADGIAVMEAVRSLPSNPNHRRNDFSHLGIQSPVRQSDAGQAGAMGMTMTWGSPEMDAVRRQMDELQNMVRLSFDLQLDMQRAIRQEVSAALACRHSGDSGANPADAADSVAPTDSRPASEGSCLICLDNTVDTVLYQCGHMCVCLSCGMRLKGMGAHCPMCRAPIRDVIRAFRCQQPE